MDSHVAVQELSSYLHNLACLGRRQVEENLETRKSLKLLLPRVISTHGRLKINGNRSSSLSKTCLLLVTALQLSLLEEIIRGNLGPWEGQRVQSHPLSFPSKTSPLLTYRRHWKLSPKFANWQSPFSSSSCVAVSVSFGSCFPAVFSRSHVFLSVDYYAMIQLRKSLRHFAKRPCPLLRTFALSTLLLSITTSWFPDCLCSSSLFFYRPSVFFPSKNSPINWSKLTMTDFQRVDGRFSCKPLSLTVSGCQLRTQTSFSRWADGFYTFSYPL